MLKRLYSFLEVLEENPLPISFRILANSVHCGYKTENPVSLLAGSQGPFLLPEISSIPGLWLPSSIFKISNSGLCPSHTLNFSCCPSITYFLLTHSPPFYTFNGQCDYIGPTCISRTLSLYLRFLN